MESKLRADLLGFSIPAPASKLAEFVHWPYVIAVDLKNDSLESVWIHSAVKSSQQRSSMKFQRCSALFV